MSPVLRTAWYGSLALAADLRPPQSAGTERRQIASLGVGGGGASVEAGCGQEVPSGRERSVVVADGCGDTGDDIDGVTGDGSGGGDVDGSDGFGDWRGDGNDVASTMLVSR